MTEASVVGPARLLFVTWDGGGNVPPLLGLARQLIARGHDVRVLGTPRSLRTRVEATGGRFRPLAGVPEWDPSGGSFEDQILWLGGLTCGPTAADDLSDELDHEPADAVVIDCMLFGALAEAERRHVPCIALVHLLYQGLVEGSWGEMWTAALPLINETRTNRGVAPFESRRQLLDHAGLVAVTCPREFDAPVSHLPGNVRYVGPIFDAPDTDAIDPAVSRLFRQPDPLVLVSFSSTYQHQEAVLQRVVDGLADLAVCVLVTLGPALPPDLITQPANVTTRSWVPHAAVLPHTSLVVTHAGHATVMAALAHGVPLLCLPMGRDQHGNAARVEAIGAGRTISSQAIPEDVCTAVREVLGSEHYRDAAQRMARIIERTTMDQTGATAVEHFLREIS